MTAREEERIRAEIEWARWMIRTGERRKWVDETFRYAIRLANKANAPERAKEINDERRRYTGARIG